MWAGELGVQFSVSHQNAEIAPQEIVLGETTRRSASVFGFEIGLISVDWDAKEAAIKVTRSVPAQGRVWLSYDPIQCGGNPWEQWMAEKVANLPEGLEIPPMLERGNVLAWLSEEYGITGHDFASVQQYEIVCAACSCPRGDRIAVLVDAEDSAEMQGLGWARVGNENGIACTMDARICPDGSAVGRTAPFCEFAPCPGGTACTEEAKVCPDGSYVGREPPTCEFAACPAIDFLARVVDQPGFVIDPVQKTTTIYADGRVIIETRELRNDDSNTETRTLSAAKVSELRDFIAASGVFGITEEDARQCMIDAPYRDLVVSVDRMEAYITGIGEECEREKLAAAYGVLEKIDSVLESASP